MTQDNRVYLRREMLEPHIPPLNQRGALYWLRSNLFASFSDSVITLFLLSLLVFTLPSLIDWLFLSASWSGPDRSACTTVSNGGINPDAWSGACWAFVRAKFDLFIYGRFPIEERWRVNIIFFLFPILVFFFASTRFSNKSYSAFLLCILFPIVSFFLLHGNTFLSLSYVPSAEWGGLLVTLVISFSSILIAFPLGIMLALGRISNMPIISVFCVFFIELLRGVPLITVLFMANIMLPLFFPAGTSFDQLLRALLGIGLFSSAYIAEVIRGGLQKMPKSQYEGAKSLGLKYHNIMFLIILPQVLRISIPSLV
ncbi:MAG: amino acid ABC transporter permease, partial [Alphaproteobacteria bacterium]|nr:amino acid ABC transporter permease [Alphaproteobacteria bacterium]